MLAESRFGWTLFAGIPNNDNSILPRILATGMAVYLFQAHTARKIVILKKVIPVHGTKKTDLPNVKGEVKRAIKATFAHLCTTLTRDKCLPLLAVKGESSGDKGRFCHAFNPYLWRASKVYFISICTPIKGVVKYVWDSGQRCDKSAAKLCLWLKSKACEKCRQMCLSLRSNVWQSCRQMRLRFKSKV